MVSIPTRHGLGMAPAAGMDTALDQHVGQGSEFWLSPAQARSWGIFLDKPSAKGLGATEEVTPQPFNLTPVG